MIKNLQILTRINKKKTEKSINKKPLKLNKKNEKENQNIEFNFRASKSILKKSCKDNKCFDKIFFLN